MKPKTKYLVRYRDNILNLEFEDIFSEKQLENLKLFEKKGNIAILDIKTMTTY